jgi:ribosomal protein L37E
LVGALYKTALASVVLGQHSLAHDLRWRLLGVRTDALAYFSNVSRLPDLVARQNTLQTAINNVQTLLETEYPLATEVYRDENGSLYVVPDLADLLGLQNGSDQTLLSLIKDQFASDGEIVPDITLDPNPWWGQDPDRAGNNHKIPPAGYILSTPVTWQSDADAVREAWNEQRHTVCPICGLRPIINKKADYCQICGDRRKGRVKDWLQDQSKTIWLDEVADRNGRLALITGTFDLTNWLDGSLVETMFVIEPPISNTPLTKSPTFARLRRIWQTTQIFWKEAQSDTRQLLTDDRHRLTIRVANSPKLIPKQTYELDLHGKTRISVLWDGMNLISIDNLSYTAIQLGIELKECKTPAEATFAVGVWLENNKQTKFQLISDDEKNTIDDVEVIGIDYPAVAYATTIPILAEPRTFMALVPADKAIDIVQSIKTRYEREMGKVRNRLPLHLGAVYFHRRTPLRAALDAGRRMLKYDLGTLKDRLWTVESIEPTHVLPDGLARGTQQFNHTIAVTIRNDDDRCLTWYVPARMGDGQTDDNWYPYIFIQNDVSDRQLTFKALRPKSDSSTEECWLVHAAELRAGDRVYFTPATFDFQWLDSAGERFEIAYNNGKRRNPLIRPYLLDELTTILKAWNAIAGNSGLTANQIYALRDLIEIKRENWKPSADNWKQDCQQKSGMFWLFCRDAINNANWKSKPEKESVFQLTDWAVSGLFADVIQLYMGVMKQKPQREENNEQSE